MVYADEWGLPELFLKTADFRIDPMWREFESLELTGEVTTTLDFSILRLDNL